MVGRPEAGCGELDGPGTGDGRRGVTAGVPSRGGDGRDDLRVEVRARAVAELLDRGLRRPGAAVGAVGGHGAVGVAAGDDAGLDRDLVAGEAVRVAGAVVVLV